MDELTEREKDLLNVLLNFAIDFSTYINGINAYEIKEISNLSTKLGLDNYNEE